MKEIIKDTCKEIEAMLLAKNESYGNSAMEPLRIFSKASPIEQLNVRIDDKLSRIARGNEFGDEDTEIDLIGYLILKRIKRKLEEKCVEKKPRKTGPVQFAKVDEDPNSKILLEIEKEGKTLIAKQLCEALENGSHC